jgi:flagellar assembly protein FliH
MNEERAQVEAELDRIRQAEYEKGLQAGIDAAHAEAQLQVKSTVGQLGETLHELAMVKAKLRREAEAEMLSLVFAVARRIVRREFVVDPDAIRGLLHAGLEQIAGKELQTIHVHPDLVDRVATELQHRGVSSAKVIPDKSLMPGDLTFETSRGILDSRIETQFVEIERGLADRL